MVLDASLLNTHYYKVWIKGKVEQSKENEKYTSVGKYGNTDDSRCSGTKRLLSNWLLVFRHEERETQFLLCWLFLHRPQSTAPPPSETGPVESQISTNVFFEITKFSAHRFWAWRHSHPSTFPIWVFLLWHLWLSYPLRTSVDCTHWEPNRSKPNQTKW